MVFLGAWLLHWEPEFGRSVNNQEMTGPGDVWVGENKSTTVSRMALELF